MPYGSNQLSFRYQYVRIPYTDYGMLCLPQQFVQVVGAIENRFFVMHETVAYPFMMSEKRNGVLCQLPASQYIQTATGADTAIRSAGLLHVPLIQSATESQYLQEAWKECLS